MDPIDLAIETAKKKHDGRSFWVGAVAIRADGTIVSAHNGTCPIPTPSAHAEARLMRKAGYGATVYVARILKTENRIAMAKPCARCQAILKNYKVKRVFYTTETGVQQL